MTMLTQKKLNLQMKILKIAKGLNKFTLSDILPMLEENEKTIQKALNDLESLNQIKKIAEGGSGYDSKGKVLILA